MKDHPQPERDAALKKLPKPLIDFIVSPTLRNIYLGIQKKHGLDFRQLVLMVDVVTATLLGLEAESALETNIHQVMHELSNQDARELVADLNDRVFKEAQRRLRENVLEPSVWSEAEEKEPQKSTDEERAAKAAEEFIENASDNDPKLKAAYERDQKAAAEWHKKMEAEREEARKQAASTPPPAEEDEEENEDDAEAKPTASTQNPVTPSAETPAPPARSILEEKLAVPTQSTPERPPAQTDTPSKNPNDTKTDGPKEAAAPPVRTHPYKGKDPYREPIE